LCKNNVGNLETQRPELEFGMKHKRALILIDHGSKFPEANHLLKEIVLQLNNKLDTGFDFITYCHMELCSPTMEDAFDLVVQNGAVEIVVHPYFLAPGRHSTSDIPRMAGNAASKHPNIKYRVTEPLGVHDKILQVVLERANG